MESTGFEGADSASRFLLERLSGLFLPAAYRPAPHASPSAEEQAQWRLRQAQAAQRLTSSGISTLPDSERASRTYIELRARWSAHTKALEDYMLEA